VEFKDFQKIWQEKVLTWQAVPIVHSIFLAYYKFSQTIFLRMISFKGSPVVAVYLRRGGGRGELLPGASDLDFFLVFEELSATDEMLFLKRFWHKFRSLKKLFPFWGETLMADRSEFKDWYTTPSLRAAEAHEGWKLLEGEDLRKNLPTPTPDKRDIFSECAKCYWSILKPLLREPNTQYRPYSLSAVEFRNAAKAAVDFFQMVEIFWERKSAMASSRVGVLSDLALEKMNPILHLRLPQEEVFPILADTLHRAFGEMDKMARALSQNIDGQVFEPVDFEERLGKDSYSFAVRELFSERLIHRHKPLLQRILVADETTHLFLILAEPNLEQFKSLLLDLREAGTSFNGASVALPVSPQTLQELERSSFLDSPFHAFLSQQEIALQADGNVQGSEYFCRRQNLPEQALRKTFLEVSLALRFQPPPDFFYVVEHLITLVLQLRVALEDHKVPVRFHAALKEYCIRHPLRAEYLKRAVGKYLNLGQEEEKEFWERVGALVADLRTMMPGRASLLEAQLTPIRERKYDADWKLQKATTDLWIEMTPFLRLEMNAMRERFSHTKSSFRL